MAFLRLLLSFFSHYSSITTYPDTGIHSQFALSQPLSAQPYKLPQKHIYYSPFAFYSGPFFEHSPKITILFLFSFSFFIFIHHAFFAPSFYIYILDKIKFETSFLALLLAL